MSFVIDKFLRSVSNAKKQNSSSMHLSMDVLQELVVEIKQLQRAIHLLENRARVEENEETPDLPAAIDADGGIF